MDDKDNENKTKKTDDESTLDSDSPTDSPAEDTSSSKSDSTSSESSDTDEDSKEEQTSPADALSRTPEDLEEEQVEQQTTDAEFQAIDKDEAARKISPFKKFLRKVNVYLLAFILLLIIAGAIAVVNYLNSQKEEPEINLATQELTEDALQQLANRDASVGDISQTLNIQGNAVIAGQTLMRNNLNVAGDIQSGGSLEATGLTISGDSNLGEAQINRLQVANDVSIEGDTSLNSLSVSGASTFSGNMTASQITASRLILSGNGSLDVPNHIRFTGPSPSRSIQSGALGSGGSASVNGSDTSGTVNVNTGNGPSAGCFVQIGFNRPFESQPKVIITPVGAAAGRTQHYVERSTTGFSICASSPAPANQVMAFDYFVMG